MSSIVRRHFRFTSSATPIWNVLWGRGEEGPAALVPWPGLRVPLSLFALEEEDEGRPPGGVGVIESGGREEFSSWRGRLLAAAVSNGGG